MLPEPSTRFACAFTPTDNAAYLSWFTRTQSAYSVGKRGGSFPFHCFASRSPRANANNSSTLPDVALTRIAVKELSLRD